MKKFHFKTTLLAFAFSILAIFSTAAMVSAASYTTDLRALCEDPEFPVLSSNESYAEEASYVGYTTSASQVEATTNSVTIQWKAVNNATKYNISLSYYPKNNFKKVGTVKGTRVKLSNLKAGTVYSVRIEAANASETSAYHRQLNCTTLFEKAPISSTTATSNGKYTFYMKKLSPANAITGYRVSYYNYKTKKSATKYFNSSSSFSLSLSQGTFYKVLIRPYLTLNGKKFVSPSGSTKYIALQPELKKSSNTSNSMTLRWNKVYSATSYTIYVKYPGSSKYKKVGTTSATSAKLNNMKLGKTYYMKVVANKKVGNTTWKTKSNYYYRLTLYRS